jgi:hypothetical protein
MWKRSQRKNASGGAAERGTRVIGFADNRMGGMADPFMTPREALPPNPRLTTKE